jgi:hypothetical protein
MLFNNYTAANWYWTVGGSTTEAYSSAKPGYVPVGDETYVAWLASGNKPTKIPTEAELNDVLLAQYPAGALHGPKIISSLSFLGRFTSDESSAIQTAALANPPTMQSLALHLYLLQLGAATVVDLTSPLTAAGLDALVAAGLLTADRKTAILQP